MDVVTIVRDIIGALTGPSCAIVMIMWAVALVIWNN